MRNKVYGFCDAGCRYRVPTYDEFLRSATVVSIKPEADGYFHILEKLKYRCYFNNTAIAVRLVVNFKNALGEVFLNKTYELGSAEVKSDLAYVDLEIKSCTVHYTSEGGQTDINCLGTLDGNSIYATDSFYDGSYDFEYSIIVIGAKDCCVYNEGANIKAEDGNSAYEVAVKNGFEGTEEEWLASLSAEPIGDLKTIMSHIDELFDIGVVSRHIFFENGSLDNSGAVVENVSERLHSNFIEILPNVKYSVSFDPKKDVLVEFYFYDNEQNLITYSDWNPPHIITRGGYKYMRILARNSANSAMNPADYSYNDWLSVKLAQIYNSEINLKALLWSNHYIKDDGTLDTAGTRFTSEMIPIAKSDLVFEIEKNATDNLWYQVHFYLENGGCSVANYYVGVGRKYPIPADCIGIRLQFRNSDNSNMPSLDEFASILNNYDCEIIHDEGEVFKSSKHSLTVGHHNIRVFNYSAGTKGCPADNVDENLPKWKKNFGKWLNCDILSIDEWHNKFDQSGTIDAYNELLKQFYPYHYDTGNGKALFSKYPCSFNEIFINQRLIVCVFTNEGEKIAVVGWLQSNTYTPEQRIAAYDTIIKYLARFDKAIIVGDFNNDSGADELQIFAENGYTLGNNGYWGQIDTCTTSTNPDFAAIDNIVTKGFIFEEFEKGDEAASSDHYPVRAKLSFVKT